MKFYVIDVDTPHEPYIKRGYDTADEASAVREDLLMYYPPSNEWHRRLRVAQRGDSSLRADWERGGRAAAKKRAAWSGPGNRAFVLPDGQVATVTLTSRQAEVMAVYLEQLKERGRAPMLTEIGEALGLTSKGSVHRWVRGALATEGVSEIVHAWSRFSPTVADRVSCIGQEAAQ